jgi:C-terminal processing protease CtpA/Prc
LCFNQFSGIGVTLDQRLDDFSDKFGHIKRAGIYIAEVHQGTGASKAGLQPHTRLLKVDGQSVGFDIELATQLLRGIEGSQVNVIVEI